MLLQHQILQGLSERLDTVIASTPAQDPAMVQGLVREMIQSLRGDLSPEDLKVFSHLKEMAGYIASMKQDIANLRPHDLTNQAIPTATDELEAVVAATEEATGKILDAAEKIDNVANCLKDSPHGCTLNDAVTTIYEASNFQDITGQRITKVVKTLVLIEDKLNQMLQVFGEISPETAEKKPAPAPAPAAISIDDPKSLLNGPQLPAAAASQDDIDALFDSL